MRVVDSKPSENQRGDNSGISQDPEIGENAQSGHLDADNPDNRQSKYQDYCSVKCEEIDVRLNPFPMFRLRISCNEDTGQCVEEVHEDHSEVDKCGG